MIRGFSTSAARHELKGDGGISRNMFSEKRDLRPHAQVSGASRLARLNDRNRLALIKRRLSESARRQY
jgi:hypothetical protein